MKNKSKCHRAKLYNSLMNTMWLIRNYLTSIGFGNHEFIMINDNVCKSIFSHSPKVIRDICNLPDINIYNYANSQVLGLLNEKYNYLYIIIQNYHELTLILKEVRNMCKNAKLAPEYYFSSSINNANDAVLYPNNINIR